MKPTTCLLQHDHLNNRATPARAQVIFLMSVYTYPYFSQHCFSFITQVLFLCVFLVLWKTLWRFFKKFKIELPQDTTISFLDIDLKKSRKDICTPPFLAAAFAIARTWDQPECPPQMTGSRRRGIYQLRGILLGHKKKYILEFVIHL